MGLLAVTHDGRAEHPVVNDLERLIALSGFHGNGRKLQFCLAKEFGAGLQVGFVENAPPAVAQHGLQTFIAQSGALMLPADIVHLGH